MLSFTSSLGRNNGAFAIFVSEDLKYIDKKGVLSSDQVEKINAFLKVLKSKNNKHDITSFDVSDKKKCFVIKVRKKYKSYFPQEIGGNFLSQIKNFKDFDSIDFYLDTLNYEKKEIINFFSQFIFGFDLKSYTFNKYKTIKKGNIDKKINYQIITSHKENIQKEYKYYNAIKEGVFLSRDLVSEPPNVLNPKKYVEEIKKLSKLGLKIKAYN